MGVKVQDQQAVYVQLSQILMEVTEAGWRMSAFSSIEVLTADHFQEFRAVVNERFSLWGRRHNMATMTLWSLAEFIAGRSAKKESKSVG